MHPLRHDAVGLLERLVAFDTTSHLSNLALIGFVEEHLAAHGVESRRVFNADRTKAGLIATVPGRTGQGGIALSGHTDVVPVTGQRWDTPPFTVTERDGRLYGRGTADMKAFLACCLAMVPGWRARPPLRPLHLLFSYDEEVGCLGALPLAEELARLRIRPALAVIGEPTEMKLVNAHKGIRTLIVTVTGKEAHSSAPAEGANAITAAARLIAFIGEMAERYRTVTDPRFTPPYTTFNVGTIGGGEANNIIPRTCTFTFEFRPIPAVGHDRPHAEFMTFVERTLAELRAAHPDYDITVTVRSSVPGLVNDDAEALPLALALAQANGAEAVSYSTEAGVFQQRGIPSVVCGPGNILQAHKPNEWLETAQIDRCLTFLGRLADH